MKETVARFRLEPSLKRSFQAAARFNHQTLSQFLVQAGIVAFEAARARGLKLKAPMKPRDGRRKQ